MASGTRWGVLSVVLLLLSADRPSAQERWVYRYNGPTDSSDVASAIVMGADGNLYAAGQSEGSGTLEDFTVVSLTPSGTERWVYRYNGPADSSDVAYSIAVGADSNLYVVGGSYGSGTYHDFIMIGLTSSGTERWVYRYNGQGNLDDLGNSIAVGADGNLYGAGQSWGSGTSRDFTVISLTPSGGERWVYRYNGPGNDWDRAYSIVAGVDSNLYAAGWSVGNGTLADFTVTSLTPSGTERWVYRYNGPANHTDGASSIVMGVDSNLYVAGRSYGSGTLEDFTVISLTPSGDERWVYRYNGSANLHDWASSIVLGTDRNVYAAGGTWGDGPHYDFTVVSLTPSGTERWVYRYNGPADSSDVAYSIAVGADSNLYVVGGSYGSGTYYDFTVISLEPSGGERWVYRYNGPGDSYDEGRSIVMAADGNLYTAGWSKGSGTSLDFTVISLTSVGVEEKPACPERSRAEARLQLSASPVPALGSAKICYFLRKVTEVKLSIYDGSGRSVKNLVKAREEAGSKVIVWDCRDSKSERVPSGTYFVRLQTPDFSTARKLIVF